MRVAVVSPYDLGEPGGVQDQVIRLTGWLAAGGHEAVAVGPGTDGPPGALLLGRTMAVPANRSRAPIALDPRIALRVRSELAAFDVVHVHEPFVPVVGQAALGVSGPAVVATFHADPSRGIRLAYSVLRGVARLRLRSARVVTAVSPVAASALRPFARVRLVPNGIDVADYGHGDRIPGRVAFLGRDEPRKGLDVLLEAWPLVHDAISDATLSVIGADRTEERDGIAFHGRVDAARKRALLAQAEVFVAPNTGGESFGLVVVEAMASGCAVVASALPAFAHVTGGAAELVAPGDATGLAERIAGLLGDDVRRTALAQRGIAQASSFDGSRVAKEYLNAYGDALARV